MPSKSAFRFAELWYQNLLLPWNVPVILAMQSFWTLNKTQSQMSGHLAPSEWDHCLMGGTSFWNVMHVLTTTWVYRFLFFYGYLPLKPQQNGILHFSAIPVEPMAVLSKLLRLFHIRHSSDMTCQSCGVYKLMEFWHSALPHKRSICNKQTFPFRIKGNAAQDEKGRMKYRMLWSQHLEGLYTRNPS